MHYSIIDEEWSGQRVKLYSSLLYLPRIDAYSMKLLSAFIQMRESQRIFKRNIRSGASDTGKIHIL